MNKVIHWTMLWTLLISIIILPSCMKKPYKTKPTLPSLTLQSADYQATQHGITLRAKVLNDQESKLLFNDYIPHAKQLPRQPKSSTVKTVIVSLDNNSNNTVTINKEHIRPSLVDYKQIYFASSSTKALKIAGGTITAGVVPFLGIATAAFLSATPGCCPCWLLVPLTIGSGTAVLSSGSFLTGSLLWNGSTKRQLHRDFKQLTLVDTVTIEPHQQKEFLFFVREQSYNKNFTITVCDTKTDRLQTTFAITLPQM